MIPVTVIEAGPCHVLQIRTADRDGYESVQLGLVVLAVAGVLAFLALKKLPKHPLARTRDRLKLDWMLTREELQ